MADGAGKNRKPCRVSMIVCILVGIVCCALVALDGQPLIPGVFFGGGAYLQDGSLQSMLLIEIPVLVNMLMLDWPMHRFAASSVVIRYKTRHRWVGAFLLSAVSNASILYLTQYGILAAATALQGSTLAGWNVMVLPALACNIGALTICCCYTAIVERYLSRASWYFLLTSILFMACKLPDTGGWSWLRWALPVSYFHFELMCGLWGSGAALGGLAVHLGLAVLLFSLQARKMDFIR